MTNHESEAYDAVVASTQAVEQILAVVVVGSFNPAILHPGWFEAQDLLPAAEARQADVEIAHPEVAIFTAEWVRVEATRERILFRTTRESHHEALRDLTVGTLSTLAHTPTSALGVNHDTKLKFDGRERYDAFGWRLAPPDNWKVLERPGMATLIELGQRTDGREGFIRVNIAPLPSEPFNAMIAINDHFDVSASPMSQSTASVLDILQSDWAVITERAINILDGIKELAT